MTGRIEKPELVKLVSQRTSQEAQTVDEVVDAFLDEIYQALKRGDSVSLRGFGSFYALLWAIRRRAARKGHYRPLPIDTATEVYGHAVPS